jgi:hypothetical protein
MPSQKVGNYRNSSFRRKPESRNIKWLKKNWTSAFAGVTTFYEVVNTEWRIMGPMGMTLEGIF